MIHVVLLVLKVLLYWVDRQPVVPLPLRERAAPGFRASTDKRGAQYVLGGHF